MKSKVFHFKYFPMDMARLVCVPLLAIYRMKRIDIRGKKYTQRLSGGAIITANHTSMEDPFLVGTAFWYRRLFFLAAEAVMSGKLKGFLLKGAGAIRIDRCAADIEAINRSVEVLKLGHLLAVFPQGQITRDENTDTIKSGAVLIALRAGVPIIPIHILPKKKWCSRRTVVMGNPINPKEYISGKFPSTGDIENITHILMEEMKNLRKYQYEHI